MKTALRIAAICFFPLLIAQTSSLTEPSTSDAKAVVELAATLHADAMKWSAPVNGLQIRIEATDLWYDTDTFFVRLQNVGNSSLRVPLANPPGPKEVASYEIHLLSSQGWKRFILRPQHPPQSKDISGPTNYVPAPSQVILQPGQSALASIADKPLPGINQFSVARAVLNVPEAKDGFWSGKLETPPFSIYPQDWPRVEGKLNIPDHFPALVALQWMGGNQSGDEPEFTKVWIANGPLLRLLPRYKPEGVRCEFEKQMLATEDNQLKMVLASEAASRGSTGARDFLLECMKTNDYEVLRSAIHAICTVGLPGLPRPTWAANALTTGARDERKITAKRNRENEEITVSELVKEEAGFALEEIQHPPTKPFTQPSEEESHSVLSSVQIVALIQAIKAGKLERDAVDELARTSQRAAIQGLIECLGHDFGKKVYWKFQKPTDCIAQALRTATGVGLGTDKAAWEYWWQALGSGLPKFK